MLTGLQWAHMIPIPGKAQAAALFCFISTWRRTFPDV